MNFKGCIALVAKTAALTMSAQALAASAATVIAEPSAAVSALSSFSPDAAWLGVLKSSPALVVPTACLAIVLLSADLVGRRMARPLWSAVFMVIAVAVSLAASATAVWPYYRPLFVEGMDAFLAALPANDAESNALFARAGSPFEPAGIALMAAYLYCRDTTRTPARQKSLREGIAGA